MKTEGDSAEAPGQFDTSVIRPLMRTDDLRPRGKGMPAATLRKIRKSLRFLHKLEMMAVNIYRYQISARRPSLNSYLIPAMCNEMTHFQDFQVKLFEYGHTPSRLRWMQWTAGMAMGTISGLCGTRTILKCNIWLENKASRAYAELLQSVDWDADTHKIVAKNQADEIAHAKRWKGLLDRDGCGDEDDTSQAQ